MLETLLPPLLKSCNKNRFFDTLCKQSEISKLSRLSRRRNEGSSYDIVVILSILTSRLFYQTFTFINHFGSLTPFHPLPSAVPRFPPSAFPNLTWLDAAVLNWYHLLARVFFLYVCASFIALFSRIFFSLSGCGKKIHRVVRTRWTSYTKFLKFLEEFLPPLYPEIFTDDISVERRNSRMSAETRWTEM